MASDRKFTMRSPYDSYAMIATKRGKCASSRKLIVGKQVANARPFETVLLLPRYVMPTMISIGVISGCHRWSSSFGLGINNGMYSGLSVK